MLGKETERIFSISFFVAFIQGQKRSHNCLADVLDNIFNITKMFFIDSLAR